MRGLGFMRACVCACVRACAGVWVCRCVGVWVCECVGVWVCGCVGVWVCVRVWGCLGFGAGVGPGRALSPWIGGCFIGFKSSGARIRGEDGFGE